MSEKAGLEDGEEEHDINDTVDSRDEPSEIVFEHISEESEEPKVEEPNYLELVLLPTGASFGELALIENRPRAAEAYCPEDTQFAVLNKTEYNAVLGIIEKRILNERIGFL